MKTLLKGEIKFIERVNNWSIEVLVKWNKRRTTVVIKSRKSDLKPDFVSCSLSKAQFISFISRSDTFNFSGEKSEFSELILASPYAISLMNSKNPSIELRKNQLIFKGSIKKKDLTSLSNIFRLNELLMEEIDELHNKSNNR
ncbi:hypothetical protein [Seonamhaeicola maritimus]|uniref:hypothetical protein n=1 Tax=Seonamhaeicola maritimus TaxID=2591822 RepID=UPI002493E790|nr:hypothetical protein [Seonamhaeicola maritimus]